MQITREQLIPIFENLSKEFELKFPEFELSAENTIFKAPAHFKLFIKFKSSGYKKLFAHVNYNKVSYHPAQKNLSVLFKFFLGDIKPIKFTTDGALLQFFEKVFQNEKLSTALNDIRMMVPLYRIDNSYLSLHKEINKESIAVSTVDVEVEELKILIFNLLEAENNSSALKVFNILINFFSVVSRNDEKIDALFMLANKLRK